MPPGLGLTLSYLCSWMVGQGVCTRAWLCVCVWGGLVLSFHHVDSRKRTQSIRLSRCPTRGATPSHSILSHPPTICMFLIQEANTSMMKIYPYILWMPNASRYSDHLCHILLHFIWLSCLFKYGIWFWGHREFFFYYFIYFENVS